MTNRLVVFASDDGTKLQAILDACENGTLDAEVVALVADKKCSAIHIAENAHIPIIFHTWGPYKIAKKLPATYKRDLAVKVMMYAPDWIVLAGWLRELADGFLEYFEGRVINVHPALPGTFTGPFALAHAFDAYQRGEISKTGITVYYAMTAEINPEDVILSREIEFLPDEEFDMLEARVRAAEPGMLLEALTEAIVTE